MPPISVADGLRTSLGPLTFEILRTYLKPEDVILVTEAEIIDAMQLVM
jgi:threonine dehydratase